VPSPSDEVPSPSDEVPSPSDEVPSPSGEVPSPSGEVPSPSGEVPSPSGEVSLLASGVEPCASEAGPCLEPIPAACSANDQDLSGLDQPERVLVLSALTARFSAAYMRWMRSQAGAALSYSNVRVLEILESEGPTIMRDIAASLGMTARNMTTNIDALEESGLVRRTPHPRDRRATIVELTSEGAKRATRVRREAVAWASDAFSSLSAEEQQQYADLLARLSGFFCH
jgi:DNA-binding MarR family transcriptional regulator